MGLPALVRVDGVERAYAWGSTSAIQSLLGREPDGRPLAELWFGAHPAGPSPVPERGAGLDEVIAADPVAALGRATVGRFGGRLPFLVKLLAAGRPLSIQVHPDRAQAEAGYAAEDARGVARDAPERNYRDRNGKPELLYALDRFVALCGFRPVAETIVLLDALPSGVGAALRDVRADLAATDTSAGLRAAFTRLLTLDTHAARDLTDRVVTACRPLAGRFASADAHGAGPDGAARVLVACAEAFPGDIGAVLTLLLNPVVLSPGQAVYVAPGTVHCYLHGLAVEVMASSDNVLRGGLTPKHVDAAELLRVTDFAELSDPREPGRDGPGGPRFRPPVPDFEVYVLDLDAVGRPGWPTGECAPVLDGRPALFACTSGRVRAAAGDTALELTPGRAAYLAGGAGPGLTLRGTGTTLVATVPSEPARQI